jgi:hypothetical protein
MAVDHRTGEGLISEAALELFGRLVRVPQSAAQESLTVVSGGWRSATASAACNCSTPGAVSETICMSMPAALHKSCISHGAATDLAGLLFEVAVRADKARRGEMLFKRYGTHGHWKRSAPVAA